jgi:hypothetical protein
MASKSWRLPTLIVVTSTLDAPYERGGVRSSRQQANRCEPAADASRCKGSLHRLGAADFDGQIRSRALGQVAYRNIPIGLRAIIDGLVRAQPLQAGAAFRTRRDHDDARTEQLGELQGEN